MSASSLVSDPGSTSLQLIRRLQSGDGASWARFVWLYYDLIRHWCISGGVAADALDDVVQDVLLALVKSLTNYRENPNHPRSFRVWLRGIARHKMADYRRSGRLAGVSVEGLDATCLMDFGRDDDADDSAESSDVELGLLARRALELARSEFDQTAWQAFTATVMDGRPSADVAAELGVSRNVVYLSKSRILRRLREILHEA